MRALSISIFMSLFIALGAIASAHSYKYELGQPEQLRVGAETVILRLLPEIAQSQKYRQSIGQEGARQEAEAVPLKLVSIDKLESIPDLSMNPNDPTYNVEFSLIDTAGTPFKGSFLMSLLVVKFKETEGLENAETSTKILASLKTLVCSGTFSRFLQAKVTDLNGNEIFVKEQHCFASKLPL